MLLATWRAACSGATSAITPVRSPPSEADAVDVDVAAAVDDDLVPGAVGEAAQVGMGHQRRRRARDAERDPLGPRPPAVGRRGSQSMQNGRPNGRPHHDFALAVELDGDDLLRSPVREPQAALVPSRRLTHRDTGEKDPCVGRWRRVSTATVPPRGLGLHRDDAKADVVVPPLRLERSRKAERQGQPSSAQQPPRRTREMSPCSLLVAVLFAACRSGSTPPGSLAWYQSRHHSKTLPCMSCRPHGVGGVAADRAARFSDGPSSPPL